VDAAPHLVALVPLSIWFVVSLLSCPRSIMRPCGLDGSELTALLLILFVLTCAWHSQLGVRVVVVDYVHGAGPGP